MKLPELFKTLGLTAAIVVASQTALLFQQSKVLAEPGSNRLNTSESLKQNEYLRSSNGVYTLYFQGDGNLVLYRTNDNTLVWTSGTGGTNANLAVMQGDGNFVLYRDSTPIWATRTQGGVYGVYLQMQDDGRAVIYNPTALWNTNLPNHSPPPPPDPEPCIPTGNQLCPQL